MTLFQERPIKPMMAKTGESFDSNDYLFEVKWDGLRALLFLQQGRLELQNRNLRDVTASYPEIRGVAEEFSARNAIIDGEVVVLTERGIPDFGRMQTRFGHNDPRTVDLVRGTNPATYVAFDLLHLNGKDTVGNPLEERKKILRKILVEGPHLAYGDHVEGEGSKFYSGLLKLGFEGVIAKERLSPYLPGTRSSSWIKIKGSQTIDAIIVGYTIGEGARASTFGSLVMAMYDDGERLIHVGNVGGGFDNNTLESLRSRLDRIIAKSPIIIGTVEAPSPIVWCKPRLVCEILYSSFTRDKKLRFPRFQRLRPDKKPEECRLDEDILSR